MTPVNQWIYFTVLILKISLLNCSYLRKTVNDGRIDICKT